MDQVSLSHFIKVSLTKHKNTSTTNLLKRAHIKNAMKLVEYNYPVTFICTTMPQLHINQMLKYTNYLLQRKRTNFEQISKDPQFLFLLKCHNVDTTEFDITMLINNK